MKIAFGFVTVLMTAMLLMASIPDILMNEQAAAVMKYLGYPVYFSLHLHT